MKQKLKLKDNILGKDIVGEIEIPDKYHLQAQIKYPHKVFTPKKYKKIKYKHKIFEE